MTYRIPEATLADKLLALVGKRRAIWIPADLYKRFGPYVYVEARKESFWRALFRRKNQVPPEEWFYPFTVDDIEPEQKNEGP